MNTAKPHHVQVRVTPAEAETWRTVAEKRDLRLSQLVRRAVREWIARETTAEASGLIA